METTRGQGDPAPLLGPPGWQDTTRGTDVRLRCLSAVDRRTVWVAGADGVVLRTQDGGDSWQSVGPPDGRALQFRSIKAFDAHHAVVLSFGAGDAARILSTDDAGEHWSEAFRNHDPAAFYNCMTFGDDSHGLAVADPVDGRFRILRSTDSGRSWHEVDPAGLPAALAGEVAFAASGTCLIGRAGLHWLATGSAARARVFRSDDGGRTWSAADTPVRSAPDAGIFALAFRDAAIGVAVGGDYRDQSRGGRLTATTADGGITWRTVAGNAPNGYRSGATWTGHEFVVVGPGGSDYSVDDGAGWTRFDDRGLDTVSVAQDGSCWAAGEHGRVALLSHRIPAAR
ncbi:photosystem II stability/assembly factor-like uncharacterized protein [Kitasatospora viridis]|uniref:Photosystem II stability/assembly factor-like uncharacterized protein n=1 Tax=Kitasatospora viridis TaxID=281105 RepID=A0A561T6D3_9ACTN|nr:photosystem II stability/assembly factor-like uncharacterized protein [Kitasatospora viridis]